MARIAVVLALAVLAVATAPAAAAKKTLWHQLGDYNFELYKAEFNKVYATEEEHSVRRTIFENNLNMIRAHNADRTKGWKLGVNHLTDRTTAEFKRRLGYDKMLGYSMTPVNETKSEIDVSALPRAVDWRNQSVITAVKDQGECGSCWTFGSAETLESHVAIKTGYLQVLSEQNILDCTPNPNKCGGTGGCQGGTGELAYAKLKEEGGIQSEWTYPYLSWSGKNFKECKFNKALSPVNVTGYVKLPSNQYEPLMNAVANVGPIAISVEAITWQHYESGIFNGCNQTNPDIDHVVQLVGYGEDNGQGYWLARNSWTPQWGEHGYIRLFRAQNEGDRCGMDVKPGDGTGCAGGPSQVKVCGACGILYDNVYPTIST